MKIGIILIFLIVIVLNQEEIFSNFENFFDKLHYDIVVQKDKYKAQRVISIKINT
jgi:hypothetical protein